MMKNHISFRPLKPAGRSAEASRFAAWSRRDLMRTIGLVAAMAGTAFPIYAKAQQQKISKSEAKYQDKPNGSEHCQKCQHFQAPNRCELVEGGISPNGWCEHFKAKNT
jgi:hypothetical protein